MPEKKNTKVEEKTSSPNYVGIIVMISLTILISFFYSSPFSNNQTERVRAVALSLQNGISEAKSVSDLEALMYKYYAKDVRQCEAGKEWNIGFDQLFEVEKQFFNILENGKFANHVVHSMVVENEKVFLQVTTSFYVKGSTQLININQVVEQQWNSEGKLVLERFWHEKQ